VTSTELTQRPFSPPAGQPRSEREVPLCVDLDGTLLKTDLLHESLLLLLRANPLYLLLLPFWLLQGKARFKQQVCGRVTPDVTHLPYNQELLAFLREERRTGRSILLVTAADRQVAEEVARHLDVFTEVLASDGVVNLSGSRKLEALEERFGPRGFDYVGNARPDLKVWRKSRQAVVVNAPGWVVRRARREGNVTRVFKRPGTLKALPRALRVHQWVKNVLVFVPLFTSHRVGELTLVAQALAGFAAFCLCASAVYILNDLFDLESDRQHWKKKKRPFAAGDLSIPLGVALAGSLLLGCAAIACLLPPVFRLVLGLYFVLTFAYSLYFKRKLLVDVHFLGGLYTIRVLAGSAATGIACSSWLLAFSMFLFLSLALVKRFVEGRALERQNIESVAGRSYMASDTQALASLGTGSGFLCVLVLALYINSPQIGLLYESPEALWLLCPLVMYWVCRVWMIAFRGKMDGDPVVFALKDRVSYLVGLCAAGVIFAATLPWPF
jgi:4-hydroxybenzoate polyprenyltransferase